MNPIEEYFQTIRADDEKLLRFCKAMPKGADIHHHALGALWPQDVLEVAISMNLWVDATSGQLYTEPAKIWHKASELINNKTLRDQVFRQWSILDYDYKIGAAADHFFDIFPKLEPVFIGHEAYWLKKIARDAAKEGLLYIETLIEVPEIRDKLCSWTQSYSKWPQNPTIEDFELFYQSLSTEVLSDAVQAILKETGQWKKEIEEDKEENALVNFQFYAIRTLEPLEVFAQLITYFEACLQSDDIVGVNLVAPEYYPNALQHYHLHMKMCQWLKAKYPSVNLALHAGELTNELVEKEHLTFHIDEAVRIGTASRIGHGVDILSESNKDKVLDFMKMNDIAIEVLPTSNEFILDIDANRHPLMTYLEKKIPVILSTDDPGLLCCTLAEQYFWVAKQFSAISYMNLKSMAINSLKYSFLPEEKKEICLSSLAIQFLDFEKQIISK